MMIKYMYSILSGTTQRVDLAFAQNIILYTLHYKCDSSSWMNHEKISKRFIPERRFKKVSTSLVATNLNWMNEWMKWLKEVFLTKCHILHNDEWREKKMHEWMNEMRWCEFAQYTKIAMRKHIIKNKIYPLTVLMELTNLIVCYKCSHSCMRALDFWQDDTSTRIIMFKCVRNYASEQGRYG